MKKQSPQIKTFKSSKTMKTQKKLNALMTNSSIKNQTTTQLIRINPTQQSKSISNSSLVKVNPAFKQEGEEVSLANEDKPKHNALNSELSLTAGCKQRSSLFFPEQGNTSTNMNNAVNTNDTNANALYIAQDPNKNANIKVFVRFRPMNDVETELIKNGIGKQCVEYISPTTIQIKNPHGAISNPYILDHVFRSDTEQKELYDLIGKGIVKDVVSGYNGTIFAYGQSGSGKTFTMYGDTNSNNASIDSMGIIPRIISEIFDYVDKCEDNITFQFKMSFMQIYKEVIYDLLTGESHLKIKENTLKGIYVDKLTEVYINSIDNFMEYVDLAQENRIVSETKLNSYSSRSHSILIFEVNQTLVNENITKKGILNLVDLAGSEKISKTGAVGETLEEAKKINLSLSALGNVIHSLTSNADHIPYRNSKLTRILQESLGGNYKTNIIVTCSPHSYHLEETTSSLQFAQRAKKIKNKVKINIKLSYEELQKIIDKLKLLLSKEKEENARLRAKLGEPQPEKEDNADDSTNNNNNNNNKAKKKEDQSDDNTLLSLINIDNEKELNGECKWISEFSVLPDINKDINVHNHAHSNTNANGSVNECQEHIKSIKILEDKLNNLTDELKEKDEIIKTLEQSNYQKEKQLEERTAVLKKTTSIFTPQESSKSSRKDNCYASIIEDKNYKNSDDDSSDDNHFKVEAVKSQIKKENVNPVNSFQDKLIKLIEENQKVNNAINTHTMTNIDQLCKDTNGNSSKDFIDNPSIKDSKAENDMQSIKTIFDDVYKQLENTPEGTKTITKLESMFQYSYLDFYTKNQLLNQMNADLKQQNDNLKNINQSLFDLIKESLESNIEISQKLNRQSFLLNEANANTTTHAYRKLSMGFEDKSPERNSNLHQMFRRKTNRITTSINRKGLFLMNKLQSMRDNSHHNTIQQIPNGLIESNANTNVNSNFNTISNTNTVLNTNSLTPNNQNINAISPAKLSNDEIAPVNNSIIQYEKEQEAKMNKINILKDFVINSLKENEAYNHNLEDIKAHYSNMIKEVKKEAIDNELIINPSNTPRRVIEIENDNKNDDMSRNKHPKFDLANDSDENLLSNNKAFQSAHLSYRKRNDNNNTISKHQRKPTANSITNQDRFEIKVPFKRMMTLTHLSPSYDLIKQKGIEELVTDYIETGSATRRFDGISVKVVNKSIKCLFTSGLNAKASIQYAPMKKKINQPVGDSNKSVYPEEEVNKAPIQVKSSLKKKKKVINV